MIYFNHLKIPTIIAQTMAIRPAATNKLKIILTSVFKMVSRERVFLNLFLRNHLYTKIPYFYTKTTQAHTQKNLCMCIHKKKIAIGWGKFAKSFINSIF